MLTRHSAEQMLEQVLALPRTYEHQIPHEYIDLNGHMNVMYYTHIGNSGLYKFMRSLGLDYAELAKENRGTFALRQVLSYFNEIHEKDEIAVHTGLVNFDKKRLHFIHYIVNLSRNKLASQDERLAIYMDMSTRKSAEWEADKLARFAEARDFYRNSGWTPELSGAIHIKS